MKYRPDNYSSEELLAALEAGPAAVAAYIERIYSQTWHTTYSQWFVENINRFR